MRGDVMQIIYLNPKRLKLAKAKNPIVKLAYAIKRRPDDNEDYREEVDYEYRHDPKHEKKPDGGGWYKTEGGWSKKNDLPEKSVKKPVETKKEVPLQTNQIVKEQPKQLIEKQPGVKPPISEQSIKWPDIGKKPVKIFSTEKGSKYVMYADGTTVRNKAPRPEHPGEQGIQPVSKKTWFVTPEHSQELSLLQTKGGDKMTLAEVNIPGYEGYIGIKYLDGKNKGKFEKRTVMKPLDKPQAGAMPVEFFGDDKTVHFGNKITEMADYKEEPKSDKGESPKQEKQLVEKKPEQKQEVSKQPTTEVKTEKSAIHTKFDEIEKQKNEAYLKTPQGIKDKTEGTYVGRNNNFIQLCNKWGIAGEELEALITDMPGKNETEKVNAFNEWFDNEAEKDIVDKFNKYRKPELHRSIPSKEQSKEQAEVPKQEKKPEVSPEEKQKAEQAEKQRVEKMTSTWKNEGYKNENISLTADQANQLDLIIYSGDEKEGKKFSTFSEAEQKEILNRLQKGDAFHQLDPVPSKRKLSMDEITDDTVVDIDGKKMSFKDVKQDKALYDQVKEQVEKETVEHTGFPPPSEPPAPPKPPQHKLFKNQILDDTNIIMPDGTKKEFKDLSDDDKKKVYDAVEKGTVSFTGMNDYTKIDKETFQSNKERTLKRFADDKVVEVEFKLKGKVTKENSENVRQNLRGSLDSKIDHYKKGLSVITHDDLTQHVDDWIKAIDESVNDGSLGDVPAEELHKFIAEDLDRIIYQDQESKTRSLGDHGVKHLTTNAHNTIKILDELGKDATLKGKIKGKDKLMALTIMANHDNGYALGDSATSFDGTPNHKKYSGIIANQERDRYEKIFGKEGADIICGKDGGVGMIQNHDESDYDWENNPLQSSVALADVTACFGKDKVQDLFLRSADAMNVCTAMRLLEEEWPPGKPPKEKNFKTKEEYEKAAKEFNDNEVKTGYDIKRKDIQSKFDKLKKSLNTILTNSDFEQQDKVFLKKQIEEMSAGYFSSASDVLSRYSGRLTGFNYDPQTKIMGVNMEVSQEGHAIDSVFGDGVALRQFSKFTDDLHADPLVDEKGGKVNWNKNPDTVFSKNNKQVIKFTYSEKKNKSITKETANILKQFKDHTVRDELNAVKRMLSDKSLKSIEPKKVIKQLSGVKKDFAAEEWDKIKSMIMENKDNPQLLLSKLKAFGLTKKEQEFLESLYHIVDEPKKQPAPETPVKKPYSIKENKLTKVEQKSSRHRSQPGKPLMEKKKAPVKQEPAKKVPVKKTEVKKKPVKKVVPKRKSSIGRWIVAAKPRRLPEKLPPRDDLKVRYKPEDLPKSERKDFDDVLNDPDLKTARRGRLR